MQRIDVSRGIKIMLARSGKNNKDLAEALRQNYQSVHNMKQGKSWLTSTIEKICYAMDWDVMEFVRESIVEVDNSK